MAADNVTHGITVGDDIALKAPLIPQQVGQQPLVCRSGNTVDGVVGAHHLADMAFAYGGLELGQVGLVQIALRRMDIEPVAQRLRAAVNGKMLGAGDGFQILRVIALHPLNKSNAHPGSQIRVFPVGLLTTAPAWVTKDVDIGGPNGQPVK